MIEHYLSPLGLIALTLATFIVGLTVFKKTNQFPLFHPLVVSSACIALLLVLLDIDYNTYQSANNIFYKILGPATVALAIPMHKEFRRIKQATKPIAISLLLGALIAPLCAIAVTMLLGGDRHVITAMLTKSVSTPIALDIAAISTGGHSGLVAGIVVFTGVVAAIVATPLYRLLKITDPRVQGLTLGINGHAAGTTRGFEISQACGAFSSLALGLTGCMTALTLPLIIRLLNG